MAGLFLIPVGKPAGSEPVGNYGAATAGDSTSVFAVLGLDIAASDWAGLLRDDNASEAAYMDYRFLHMMTDWNESPDAYLQCFLENIEAHGLPANAYTMSAFSAWTGRYTLLGVQSDQYSLSGNASVDDRREISIDGDYKYADLAFYYEPGILIGQYDSDYDYGLQLYRQDSPRYRPLILGGWNRNQYAKNSGDTSDTMAMANGIYAMAKRINNNWEEKMVASWCRYNGGDIVQTGADIGNFALGIYYYAQSLIESGTKMPGYCTGISIAEYGGTITITNESTVSARIDQYLDGLATLVPANRTYESYSDLANDVALIMMDTSKLTQMQVTMLNLVGIKLDDINYLTPLAPLDMDYYARAENLLGVPYFFGLLYEGRGSDVGEYDYIAYFLKNIYHVKLSKVEDAVEEFVINNCGSGYGRLTYNHESIINDMIEKGAEYYHKTSEGTGMWTAADDGMI